MNWQSKSMIIPLVLLMVVFTVTSLDNLTESLVQVAAQEEEISSHKPESNHESLPTGESIHSEEETESEMSSESMEETQEESQESELEESSAEESVDPSAEEVTETPDLLDIPYLPFIKNKFASEDQADAFIRLIQDDPLATNQFQVSKEENGGQGYTVTLNYSDQATEDGRYILFYISAELASEDQAYDLGNQLLNLYPDLFFDYEPVMISEGVYDLVFGTRYTINTQALVYQIATGTLTYSDQRQPYTYTLDLDDQGNYEDPIQEAIKQEPHPSHRFTEEMNEDTHQVKITMVPIESDASPGSASQEPGSVADDQTRMDKEDQVRIISMDSSPADSKKSSDDQEDKLFGVIPLSGDRDSIFITVASIIVLVVGAAIILSSFWSHKP